MEPGNHFMPKPSKAAFILGGIQLGFFPILTSIWGKKKKKMKPKS